MEIIHLEAYTDADGHLLLDAATPIKDQDVEVIVKSKAPNPWDGVPRDDKDWPVGSFEHFAGAFSIAQRPRRVALQRASSLMDRYPLDTNAASIRAVE